MYDVTDFHPKLKNGYKLNVTKTGYSITKGKIVIMAEKAEVPANFLPDALWRELKWYIKKFEELTSV